MPTSPKRVSAHKRPRPALPVGGGETDGRLIFWIIGEFFLEPSEALGPHLYRFAILSDGQEEQFSHPPISHTLPALPVLSGRRRLTIVPIMVDTNELPPGDYQIHAFVDDRDLGERPLYVLDF